MIKTLVIHPKDSTTDMLCRIYKDTDWTIINTNVSKSYLEEQIKLHDRIIMLGHGTPQGLIMSGYNRLIINSDLVYLLRDKDCVCMWCNADKFVVKYNLKGFYSGMIISESNEALYEGLYNFSDEDVFESNELFSDLLKECINMKPEEMVKHMNEKYISENNKIIHYNQKNIYFR